MPHGPHAENSHRDEWNIRKNVPEMRHRRDDPPVGELVIRRILRHGRAEQRSHHRDRRQQEQYPDADREGHKELLSVSSNLFVARRRPGFVVW
jgi:hypothetical protein